MNDRSNDLDNMENDQLKGAAASFLASWIGLFVIACIGWLSWLVVLTFPLIYGLGILILWCIGSLMDAGDHDG